MSDAEVLFVVLLAFSSILLPNAPTSLPTAPPVSSTMNLPAEDPKNSTILVDPYATNKTSLTIGQTFSVNVNVMNLSPINAFVISLAYDPSVIDALSISYAGGLFDNSPITALYCIDGSGQVSGGTGCPSTGQGPGIANYALGLLANDTLLPSVNGTLFSMGFKVTGTGLSPIHFLSISMAVSGVGISTPLSADGYFTNSYCYDTRLCTPSVAMIHVMSSILKIGVPITLNATGSHGTNGPKDNITSYSWDWGDGHVTPPGPNPVDTHAYYSPANYIVTVNIEDSYNARGLASVTLSVVRFRIDLSVTFQSLSSQIFYPGDQISLPAVVQNLGTNVSTSTFRFVIQNRTLYETQLPLMPPVGQVTEHSTWNTTGLTPQSYTVAAEIDPVTAVISGESVIVENDTSNNINHVYIILREPIPPGYGSFLGLGLPATGALGILLLAGVVWSSIFLRRRKKPVEEAI